MSTRVARACFGAWVLILTGVYYAFPGSHLYSWAALGYSCAIAVLVGVRMHQPRHRLPWYLISGALACFTTGDSVANLIRAMGDVPSFPGRSTKPILSLGYWSVTSPSRDVTGVGSFPIQTAPLAQTPALPAA